MTTSGTTTWKIQRDAIVSAALRKLAVLSGGAVPETYQITDAVEALNAMIKGFHADGMPVWAMKTYSFTPTAGVYQYNIGVGATLNTPMPLKIVEAWRNELNSSNVPLNIYTDYDFNVLPLVNSSGVPVNLYYQPLSYTGVINLWPIPQAPLPTISIRYQRPFEDMTGALDDLDFPPYWSEAIIYGLAARLAPEYGLPLQDRQFVEAQAMKFKMDALSFGTEEGSLYLQPDWSGRW